MRSRETQPEKCSNGNCANTPDPRGSESAAIALRLIFRVVVGPARDVIERATLMKQVQDQGFGDAYFVTN